MVIFSHCFWDKCASWLEFCTCLTPFISLTSSLQLTWQLSNYWTCRPTYVEHNVRPIVLGRVCLYCGENIKCGMFFKCPCAPWWLGTHDGCMVDSVFSFAVQAVSYCVIKHLTSGPVPIQCGRIFSHTKCSTISLYDCVRLRKSLVNNYRWELSARFMHNNILVQKSWAIWGCFCWIILSL